MSVGMDVRLIGTSDLHANIYPYDYYRDRPDATVGLAKTAALIAQARAEARNCLLLDNGDIIQGAPLGDWAAAQLREDSRRRHPMMTAMNALRYDAAALGNHEFNYGLDVLEAAIAGAAFPVLSCNIFKPDGGFYFQPWVLLDRQFLDESGAPQRLRIGVIGFTTPQIVQWNQSMLAGRATTRGIVECAGLYVPQLRAQGADLVVALCHSGLSRKPPTPGDENAAIALAEVAGIDVLITGHQHLQLPGPDYQGFPGVDASLGAIHGKPAFMPGFWGSHLGVIDLRLTQDAGAWRLASSSVTLRPIYSRDGDDIVSRAEASTELLALASEAHAGTLAYVRAPVGDLATPLHSYFALLADDPSVQIVNAAQLWYARREAATTPVLQTAPLLSASAPFKWGGRGGPDYFTDVPAGAIAIKNIADLYVYPNALCVVKVSGAQLREWLERSASLYRRIDPQSREPQPLVDDGFAAYNFDVIDGVTYAIDVTQAARYDNDGKVVAPLSHRIQDLQFADAAVQAHDEFLVVTNSYRAGGGGEFPGCDGSTVIYEAPDSNRDALTQYVVATSHLDPRPDGNWRFAPWPETCVVTFRNSPALAGIEPPPGLRITRRGAVEGGFVEYRLELTA